MTFRARPVVRRFQRPSWDTRDRRNFYLNLGFGLAVVAAVVILGIAVALSYYNDHLASVGSVDGQAITKDELRDRTAIESWRLDVARRRVNTQATAGQLTQAQAELRTQQIDQERQSVIESSLEKIIDNRIQAKLAADEGVTVTDADVDAKLLEEATTPESRHAWQIEVKPAVAAGASEPTPEQKATARTTIEKALADIKGGTSWEDVARTVSTDSATAAQAGDLGWLTKDDRQTDEAFLAALFGAAAVNTPTDIVEGADGTFRIGRVSEIVPEAVDGAYQDTIANDGIDIAKYRAVVRGDVVRTKLEDKLVADASKPAPQRETSEIYISQSTVDLPDDAVKVRHILYSPKDDPAAASNGDIPADDPSWAKAKSDADAAYAKLQSDVSQFDTIARAESDEEPARGPDGTGGVLDAYVSSDSSYVESFSKPILDAKPTDGQLLPPIKTEFGYHIVQVLSHAPDLKALKSKIDAGQSDFAAVARDVSEGAEASRGGDLGWIARGQLQKELTDPIFAAPIGTTSAVVAIPDDGQYLFLVKDEEERTPEGRQLDAIRTRAFSDWYQPKKDAAKIERDESIAAGLAS
ncbi:MAG TPA: peptidylprolyl isomerase [Candidatus Limnocylindrales bacterium]|nr:peptidylprolyl isomerase [Candidatus Limnocylindrales bacterium]